MIYATESFDPLHVPLQGELLIEASAGTRKTFNIIILYLRLLLGLSGNTTLPRPLNVDNILVITSETTATELRSRIRANIHDLRIACLRQSTNNTFFKNLLNKIIDKQQAAQWLLLAEQQMDKATIFTIYTFCQRMLSLATSKSDMLHEQQLIEDECKLHYQACVDFWRRHCYPLSRDIAEIVYTKWKGPRELFYAINRYLKGKAPFIKSISPTDETLESRHKKIISCIIGFKQKWQESVHNIEYIIENSDIDRSKFNRSNQAKWIKIINTWTQKETRNYQLPNILGKFSQSFLAEQTKINGIVPKHPLFVVIDNLLTKPLTLNDLVLARAITEIRKIIIHERRRLGKSSFDDILFRFSKALNSKDGKTLADNIRIHFPVAIIDEFQDIYPQQYHIFSYIWYQQPKTVLLLIGDPKQATDSFRGANIFTYIKARREIKKQYKINTNWRSSPSMVASINILFSRKDAAFIFREIPFLPTESANVNSTMHFEWQGKTQPAIRFWLIDGKKCNVKDYKIFMARQAAAQIRDWLSVKTQGKALLWRGKVSQSVKASDITILVSNYQEAMLMQNTLTVFGIPSLYLSNDNSVFNTLEARETLRLLQAVISPEQKSTLRSTLASYMFGLTSIDIDHLNNNEFAWDEVVAEFTNYREVWQKRGITAMIREVIAQRHIAENMLATPGGERRLANLLHISELLQIASLQYESKSALIRWLIHNINQPSINSVNQQIRLENNKNLVQIVLIHKSKGLECPLVWLPFIANYHPQDQSFYHDRVSFKPILDLSQDKYSLELAEVERLAKDMRLLYLALTRSIWHCSLGVAPLFKCLNKKIDETDFHHSAIGYLIQKGEPKDAVGLRIALKSLCNEHIALHIPSLPDNSCCKFVNSVSPALGAREICRTIADDWKITSYSNLQKHEQKIVQNLISEFNTYTIATDKIKEKKEKSVLTPHHFPRGISPGTFLHWLLKNLDFTQPISSDWVLKMLKEGGYESYWQPMLSKWLAAILKIPLTNSGISLNQISMKDKQMEVEFYLSIDESLKASTLDSIMRKYDSLSKICLPLDFNQVRGMLKGFIDLIFRYNDRYYLLDYKSNWLGESSEAYTRKAIVMAMCSHRYDLQYQIYVLALHRYLRYRIENYNYKTHFGEVIYLFLRGVNEHNPNSGIFTTRPTDTLIENMDQLFAKI